MKLRTGLLAASAVAVAMTGSAAFAQEGIEIVTVTAAKREQNVQDVPISMNVVGRNELAKFNTANLNSLMSKVPTLFIQKSPTNVGVYMRGFGTAPANPSLDMAVSVYYDGIYVGKSREMMADFFDVARIEVLRGPQGGNLGKNTAAGAISIVTANPTDEFEGSASVLYNFDHKGVETEGYVSGPVTDTLKARLALRFVDKAGWLTNTAYGNRKEPDTTRKQGRLTLEWQPSGSITNRTKFEYYDWNTLGNSQVSGSPTLPVEQALEAACCTKNSPGPQGRSNYDKQHGYKFSNTLEVDLGDGLTLVSVSGYNAFKSDSLGEGNAQNPSGFGTRFIEAYQQGSQELRLVSPVEDGNAFDWIVGAYVDYSRYRIDNPIQYSAGVPAFAGGPTAPGFAGQPALPGELALHFRNSNFTYSLYASGTWHITEDLRLLGNARFTRSSKSATYVQEQISGTRTAATGGVFGQPLFVGILRTNAGNNGSNFFDPSITLQYDLFDDAVKLYANWGKGSKGAGFDALNRTVLAGAFVFRPEISQTWEVGAKTRYGDWLTFDIAAFILNFKNMQVSGFDPAFNALITRNAGEAESKGVEVVLGLRPFEGLSIDASANYIDARFVDFPGGACPAATSVYVVPGCVTPPGTNRAGIPLVFVPVWSGNVSANYVHPIGDDLKVGMTVAADMRSSVWINEDYNPISGKQPGMAKLHLRFDFGDIDDRWNIAAIGKNVTNVLTTGNATGWPLEPGSGPRVIYFIEEPANWSLQATLKF